MPNSEKRGCLAALWAFLFSPATYTPPTGVAAPEVDPNQESNQRSGLDGYQPGAYESPFDGDGDEGDFR
jgi:hypothetical protein